MIVKTVFPASQATAIDENDDEPPSSIAFLSLMDETAPAALSQALPCLFSFFLSRIQHFPKRFRLPSFINIYQYSEHKQTLGHDPEALCSDPEPRPGTRNSMPAPGLYIRTICSDLCFLTKRQLKFS